MPQRSTPKILSTNAESEVRRCPFKRRRFKARKYIARDSLVVSIRYVVITPHSVLVDLEANRFAVSTLRTDRSRVHSLTELGIEHDVVRVVAVCQRPTWHGVCAPYASSTLQVSGVTIMPHSVANPAGEGVDELIVLRACLSFDVIQVEEVCPWLFVRLDAPFLLLLHWRMISTVTASGASLVVGASPPFQRTSDMAIRTLKICSLLLASDFASGKLTARILPGNLIISISGVLTRVSSVRNRCRCCR